MLSLRSMTGDHLGAVQTWLRLPHVARWWTPQTTAEQEIATYRRVLEKNGFELVAVRPAATQPTDTPMAIYRLAAL